MLVTTLPPPVRAFVQAIQIGDLRAVLATLHAAAVLVDQNRRFERDALATKARLFLNSNAVKARPIYVTNRCDELVLTMLLTSQKLGTTTTNWCFSTEDDRIKTLKVEVQKFPSMPPVILRFIEAINTGDHSAILRSFAPDAMVNDQLCDYWGVQQIAEWAAQDVVDKQMTMRAVHVIVHYGNVVLTACVDGSFDKRGLPDPLLLKFYFSAAANKIVQLIILRNQPW